MKRCTYKSDLAEQASKAHRLLFIRNDLFYTYKNQNAPFEGSNFKKTHKVGKTLEDNNN